MKSLVSTLILLSSLTIFSELYSQRCPQEPLTRWRMAKEYAKGYRDWTQGAWDTSLYPKQLNLKKHARVISGNKNNIKKCIPLKSIHA